MRIIWNQQEARFEAELTTGPLWSGDKDSLSAAKFSCTGPPGWTWFCTKASILNGIKQNRPPSGLTITPEALARYKALLVVDNANAVVMAALAAAKKAQKKASKFAAETAVPVESEVEHGEFDYLKIPAKQPFVWAEKYTPPAPPTTLCYLCQTPIYFHECQQPPTCLDCEFPQYNESAK